MQVHTLRSKTIVRRSRRIGRGGKRGTTSGRGTKGQKARAGHKIRPELRDTLKRIPKLRGYKFHSFREKPVVVSLRTLEKSFEKGEAITVDRLLTKALIARRHGRVPPVKILGDEKITKPLSVVGISVSRSARFRITEAGGSVRDNVR